MAATTTYRFSIAGPNDLEPVLALVRAFHAFEDISLDDASRRAGVEQLLGDASLGFVVLVHGGDTLAGYLAVCLGFSIEFGGTDAFVDELYLEPAHRGAGAGSAVLEYARGVARDRGVRQLHLEVARNNDRARRLYSRMGFVAREKYVLMSTAP